MNDDINWDEWDDGWRYCERCGNGFTTWEGWESYEQDCGYHAGADELLCESCWEEEETKEV